MLSADYIISPKIGGSGRKGSVNKLASTKTDDEKIKLAWDGFKHYYEIRYDPELSMDENVEASLSKMMEHLRPFLPETVAYRKPSG